MIRRFNERLAVLVTRGVSTMWCAYAFAALAIYGGITQGFSIQWVSQEFLQLVLLSVIMVGQSVQAQQIGDLHDKVDRHHREHMKRLG